MSDQKLEPNSFQIHYTNQSSHKFRNWEVGNFGSGTSIWNFGFGNLVFWVFEIWNIGFGISDLEFGTLLLASTFGLDL